MEDISKEVAEKFAEQMTAIAKKHTEGLISADKMNEELGKKFTDFAKAHSLDEVQNLRKQLDEVGLELKSIKEKKTGDVVYKSFYQQAVEQMNGKKLADLVKDKAELTIDLDQLKGLEMFTKSVGTVVSGGYGMSAYDTNWSYQPLNPPVVRQYSNVMSTSLPVYSYYDLGTREGGAGNTSEGSPKTQSDATPVLVPKTPTKITSYWDFTEEAMDDLPGFMAEMERELLDQINLKEDQNFISVIDDSPAYSATGIGVPTPGIADVIMAAATQISLSNFSANLAMLNPVDFANFMMGKDDVGAYLIPPFVAANGASVAGITVVKDNNIEAGHIAVGDFTKFYIRDYKTLTVRLGYSGTNFKSNILTAVGEKRVFYFIKTSHANAFVYDEISDIKSAITIS